MANGKTHIDIGLVGAGTVGGGFVKVFSRQERFFRERLGLPVRLARIADANTRRFSTLPVGDALCSADANDILNDPEIDVVVELVGGTTFARSLILAALEKGKHVITANKALLAEYGPEIFEAAERNNVSVHFEASVGGGMPVIKTIREALVGNEVSSVETIINGTCNYILTQMTETKRPFAEVLAEAQAKGYAEADPTLDIGGGDSGHKVSIMASLLYAGYVEFAKIGIEGIQSITPEDIAFADTLGYRIKLLGIIKRDGDGPIDARVHPAMLRKDHILASVSDAFNAVLLKGDAVDDILLYGRGAGEFPTASAVVGDLIDVARDIIGGTPRRLPLAFYGNEKRLPLKPLSEILTRYYLRFSVVDRPGVLAAITASFGKHDISIMSVVQPEIVTNKDVPVIFITHVALERNLRNAVTEIERLDFVKAKAQVIRIEG